MASTTITPLGLEGPLSKWTNVMKGWQYRWFVLDHETGLLSYYTSKDKMKRGSRRGCVRLRGAVIGIDDEEESTFTITVDQKTFHFQAQNEEERSKWVDYLQETIIRHNQPNKYGAKKRVTSERDAEQKILEADAYLQLLIDQVDALVQRAEKLEEGPEKERIISIKNNANAMIESIKQGIVMLQIAKYTVSPSQLTQSVATTVNGSPEEHEVGQEAEAAITTTQELQSEATPSPVVTNGAASSPISIAPQIRILPTEDMPIRSYSSSEDEWEDAEESLESKGNLHKVESVDVEPVVAEETKYADDSEEEALDCEKHGSVITHLLSQVRLGMDLTKVVLPTFILEKRSLLEMYADFFAHPEFFAGISDLEDPKDRMIMVLRWYLSSFHAGRKGSVAKKPYNPLLGETFRCLWDLGDTVKFEKEGELSSDGPVPWSKTSEVCFIAEQVSHHPPISAFYAECPDKQMEFNAHIWTKSKFLGLSIGVEMVGQACVSDLLHEEEYIATFPNGYGRSILTVPWFEMGGKCNITCAKTGFSANINFHTKPFYGGKLHRISAEVLHVSDKKPLVTMEGEWNDKIIAKYPNGNTELFIDTKALDINKKKVKPIEQQEGYESRKLWKHVTNALKAKSVEKATEHKHFLEERQRREAKERKASGEKYITTHFHEDGACWVYSKPLQKRLSERVNNSAIPELQNGTVLPLIPGPSTGMSVSQPVSPDHRRHTEQLDQSDARKAVSHPNLLQSNGSVTDTPVNISDLDLPTRSASDEMKDLIG